jgi:hypothetical protein
VKARDVYLGKDFAHFAYAFVCNFVCPEWEVVARMVTPAIRAVIADRKFKAVMGYDPLRPYIPHTPSQQLDVGQVFNGIFYIHEYLLIICIHDM